MATAATGLAVNATSAGAEGGPQGARAKNPQPSLEGGGLGHDDGVARPVHDEQNQFTAEEFTRIVRENMEIRIRMDVQAEERSRTEKIELERLQLGGGMGVPVEQRTQQPGSFLIGLRTPPLPKLDNSKTDHILVWKKQFTSWAVTNSCEDALLETTNPIVIQGPNTVSREELVFRHGQARVASAGRV